MGPVRKLRDGRRIRFPGWFSLNNVRLLRLPPLSPENPIEHLFAFVKRKLRGKRFENKDELWSTIMEIWADIPKTFSPNLLILCQNVLMLLFYHAAGPQNINFIFVPIFFSALYLCCCLDFVNNKVYV